MIKEPGRRLLSILRVKETTHAVRKRFEKKKKENFYTELYVPTQQ